MHTAKQLLQLHICFTISLNSRKKALISFPLYYSNPNLFLREACNNFELREYIYIAFAPKSYLAKYINLSAKLSAKILRALSFLFCQSVSAFSTAVPARYTTSTSFSLCKSITIRCFHAWNVLPSKHLGFDAFITHVIAIIKKE